MERKLLVTRSDWKVEKHSLSFTTVATEDSSALLDVTVQLLQEIKDIYGADKSEEERDQIVQSLLSKLTSLMTDAPTSDITGPRGDEKNGC